ncbi:hypothetical protein DEU38_12313 [Rhodococcus sp. AG1013]|uniref:CIS tube protein n=1 Tax=Rhodococcus sp. AG1013 TaxID=2183996 RepID=UPI000E0B4EAE|nr:peptidase M23 [Rhodococcus sp. AG1013]RDI17178.1 hypothetical protein DEU38_12313 [Rhodococcus sp. AG1013]
MTEAVAIRSDGADTKPGARPGATGAQVHASLELYEPRKAPGGSQPGGHLGSIDFQFNPKEVTIAKTAKWGSKPTKGAKKAGPPEFLGSEPSKLSLEMFFDAWETQDNSVVTRVDALMKCCVPTENTSGTAKALPPLVIFTWGGLKSFPGFVTQVSAKFTRFSSSGVPIRAVCTVNLEEMPGGKGGQNPSSQSVAARSTHTMVAGDCLPLLAHAEYGDAALWRNIAAYNGIDDPMRIPDGTAVMLPARDDLTRMW